MCVFCQGPGLLVADDDTAFHGEFSDDWIANGKVQSISVPVYLCIKSNLCSVTKKKQLVQLHKIEYDFIHLLHSLSLLLQGVLSLANGDCLEGLFSGEWTTGLKVVGTYTKPAIDDPENKEKNLLL